MDVTQLHYINKNNNWGYVTNIKLVLEISTIYGDMLSLHKSKVTNILFIGINIALRKIVTAKEKCKREKNDVIREDDLAFNIQNLKMENKPTFLLDRKAGGTARILRKR